MTQQQYYAPPQPQYPAPAPQQAYPPQFPQAPQQVYPAPAAPVYQQPYPAPAPAAPAQPLAQGTLDDFYNQPSSGGGPSLKFEQVGQRYVGVVSRPLGPGDVQQQTDTQGRPLFFRDGRPKWVMKVPLQMQPSQQYPDGQAQWYVKGGARDELTRAMAEAGAPAGPPEQGAVLDITFVSTRPSGQGMNPAKVFRVVYTPPQGTGAPSPAPVTAPVEQQAQPQPQVQQAPQYIEPPAQPQYAPTPAPAPQAPVAQAPVQQPAVQPQAPVPPAAQQAPAPGLPAPAGPAQGGLQAPPGLDPEQAALLARITGQGQ